MQISVALDSPRRRDIEFYDMDDDTLTVTVYAKDGDTTPLTVDDVEMSYDHGHTLEAGDMFTASFEQREPYTLRGSVNGKSTTLAYGLLVKTWDGDLYVRSYNVGTIFTHTTPMDLDVFDGGVA